MIAADTSFLISYRSDAKGIYKLVASRDNNGAYASPRYVWKITLLRNVLFWFADLIAAALAISGSPSPPGLSREFRAGGGTRIDAGVTGALNH